MLGLAMRFAAIREGAESVRFSPLVAPLGEGHAPVAAVLLASAKEANRRRADSRNWPPEGFRADGL
jgi:hypothetical protein